MATRFGKFQTLAQRLITKNARLVTIQVASTTPGTPAEPWLPNAAATTIVNVPAVFLEYKNQEIDGTLVMLGDKRCLVAKLDVPNSTLKTKDVVLDGTNEWKIQRIKTLQPGNVAETIMYELQVRA